MRLGSGGADEVKNHPFFANSDWPKLLNCDIKARFISNAG